MSRSSLGDLSAGVALSWPLTQLRAAVLFSGCSAYFAAAHRQNFPKPKLHSGVELFDLSLLQYRRRNQVNMAPSKNRAQLFADLEEKPVKGTISLLFPLAKPTTPLIVRWQISTLRTTSTAHPAVTNRKMIWPGWSTTNLLGECSSSRQTSPGHSEAN